MEILASIGLDYTIAYQFVIFLVGFLVLNYLVFTPYFKAFEERAKRTVGGQGTAEALLDEAETLELEYEKKAKQLNREHKAIYDKTRSEALHEYDEIVSRARESAQQMLAASRTEITELKEKAKTELMKEVPIVGSAIATKLLGKEV